MARSQPGQKSLVCRAQGGCGKVPGQELKEGQPLKLPFFITGETPDILAVSIGSHLRWPRGMWPVFLWGRVPWLHGFGRRLKIKAMLGPLSCISNPASFETGCSFCSWLSFALCLLSAFVKHHQAWILLLLFLPFSAFLRCLF